MSPPAYMTDEELLAQDREAYASVNATCICVPRIDKRYWPSDFRKKRNQAPTTTMVVMHSDECRARLPVPTYEVFRKGSA